MVSVYRGISAAGVFDDPPALGVQPGIEAEQLFGFSALCGWLMVELLLSARGEVGDIVEPED